MSYSDPLIPQAFSLVLLQSEPQVDLASSQELQRLWLRIQVAVQQNSPDLEAAIQAYLQCDPELQQQFESAYDQLERQTHAQERTKFLRMDELRANGQAALTWQDIALPILTTDAGLEAIKSQFKSYKTRISAASPQTQIYWMQVQQALTAQEAKEISILQAIEKNPLTIRDLSYRLNLPLNLTSATVQSLWQQGYLDRINAPLLQILLPNRHKRQGQLPPDVALALTAKGYFRLHPLLQPSRSKSA